MRPPPPIFFLVDVGLTKQSDSCKITQSWKAYLLGMLVVCYFEFQRNTFPLKKKTYHFRDLHQIKSIETLKID